MPQPHETNPFNPPQANATDELGLFADEASPAVPYLPPQEAMDGVMYEPRPAGSMPLLPLLLPSQHEDSPVLGRRLFDPEAGGQAKGLPLREMVPLELMQGLSLIGGAAAPPGEQQQQQQQQQQWGGAAPPLPQQQQQQQQWGGAAPPLPQNQQQQQQQQWGGAAPPLPQHQQQQQQGGVALDEVPLGALDVPGLDVPMTPPSTGAIRMEAAMRGLVEGSGRGSWGYSPMMCSPVMTVSALALASFLLSPPPQPPQQSLRHMVLPATGAQERFANDVALSP